MVARFGISENRRHGRVRVRRWINRGPFGWHFLKKSLFAFCLAGEKDCFPAFLLLLRLHSYRWLYDFSIFLLLLWLIQHRHLCFGVLDGVLGDGRFGHGRQESFGSSFRSCCQLLSFSYLLDLVFLPIFRLLCLGLGFRSLKDREAEVQSYAFEG